MIRARSKRQRDPHGRRIFAASALGAVLGILVGVQWYRVSGCKETGPDDRTHHVGSAGIRRGGVGPESRPLGAQVGDTAPSVYDPAARRICVEVDGLTPPSVMELEVQSQTKHFFRDIPGGDALCLDIEPVAVLRPSSRHFEPMQVLATRPGTYGFAAVPDCGAQLRLVTEEGGPWSGTLSLSGVTASDGEQLRQVQGAGPHYITTACGTVVRGYVPEGDLRAFFRMQQGPIELTLPTGPPPCTTVHVVDASGEAVEAVASRWAEVAPGALQVCSYRTVQNLKLSAPGYVSVVAWVDMERQDATVVLPTAVEVHVECVERGEPRGCEDVKVECGDRSNRSLVAGSVQRKSECRDTDADSMFCSCEPGAPVFARRRTGGWERCERTSPVDATCEFDDATASLLVDVPPPDHLLGFAWHPDQGIAVSPLGSPLMEGLQPERGTAIALTANGWDSARLTLSPEAQTVWRPVPKPYALTTVVCSEPVTVTWWVNGAAIASLDAADGSTVPTPAPPLAMDGLVHCASGDHMVVSGGGEPDPNASAPHGG